MLKCEDVPDAADIIRACEVVSHKGWTIMSAVDFVSNVEDVPRYCCPLGAYFLCSHYDYAELGDTAALRRKIRHHFGGREHVDTAPTRAFIAGLLNHKGWFIESTDETKYAREYKIGQAVERAIRDPDLDV